MNLRRLAPFLLLVGAACSNDLPPRSFLDGLRVLAITADPLEVGPAAPATTVNVVARTYPEDAAADGTWTFCPFTLGAAGGDVCAVPQCETPLGTGPTASARPQDLALACLSQFGGTTAGGGQLPTTIPDVLEVLFRYHVETASDVREAVLRVPFYPNGAPTPPNLPPVASATLAGVAPGVDGKFSGVTLKAGDQLVFQVNVDPASAQPYTNDAGTQVTEALFTTFYTTAGRFDYDRGIGLSPSVKLKHERLAATDTVAQLYAVVRDDRDGATVLGPYTVDIAP